MYRTLAGFVMALVLSITMNINLHAQGLGSLNFIHELSKKSTATVDDAVRLFLLTIEKNPGTRENNLETLKNMKLIKMTSYKKDEPVRRGLVALMVARHLKLKDSLMFDIFGSERYAYRACAAEEIMDTNQSEWDRLSGDELIEIMGIVGKILEGTDE